MGSNQSVYQMIDGKNTLINDQEQLIKEYGEEMNSANRHIEELAMKIEKMEREKKEFGESLEMIIGSFNTMLETQSTLIPKIKESVENKILLQRIYKQLEEIEKDLSLSTDQIKLEDLQSYTLVTNLLEDLKNERFIGNMSEIKHDFDNLQSIMKKALGELINNKQKIEELQTTYIQSEQLQNKNNEERKLMVERYLEDTNAKIQTLMHELPLLSEDQHINRLNEYQSQLKSLQTEISQLFESALKEGRSLKAQSKIITLTIIEQNPIRNINYGNEYPIQNQQQQKRAEEERKVPYNNKSDLKSKQMQNQAVNMQSFQVINQIPEQINPAMNHEIRDFKQNDDEMRQPQPPQMYDDLDLEDSISALKVPSYVERKSIPLAPKYLDRFTTLQGDSKYNQITKYQSKLVYKFEEFIALDYTGNKLAFLHAKDLTIKALKKVAKDDQPIIACYYAQSVKKLFCSFGNGDVFAVAVPSLAVTDLKLNLGETPIKAFVEFNQYIIGCSKGYIYFIDGTLTDPQQNTLKSQQNCDFMGTPNLIISSNNDNDMNEHAIASDNGFHLISINNTEVEFKKTLYKHEAISSISYLKDSQIAISRGIDNQLTVYDCMKEREVISVDLLDCKPLTMKFLTPLSRPFILVRDVKRILAIDLNQGIPYLLKDITYDADDIKTETINYYMDVGFKDSNIAIYHLEYDSKTTNSFLRLQTVSANDLSRILPY